MERWLFVVQTEKLSLASWVLILPAARRDSTDSMELVKVPGMAVPRVLENLD
jgi:hypothetical protein